jgi:hypothetical protein
MTKEIKTDAEILAILNETPLAGLINALRTGEFGTPPNGVASHETVIGELTNSEKAIWSALELLRKKAKEIGDTNNAMIEEAEQKGEEVDNLQVHLNKAEHEATTAMLCGLKEMMWYLIKKHVGIPAMEADALGIRDGFKLVIFSSDHVEMETLFKMLMGSKGDLMTLQEMFGRQ